MVSTNTSFFTQAAAKDLGFVDVCEQSYDDFEAPDGSGRVFAGKVAYPHVKAVVSELVL